jgi:hypothetical protein
MSDPVRSIRVACNLAERFKALVRMGGSVADLELRIGEAQQIYPEIWRHLDEARAALVAQGRAVVAFDALRTRELVALGVTDVDSRTEINAAALIVGRLQITTVKSATFNVAGYSRAVAACNALQNAMPEVDFAALARAEDQEIAKAGSLRSGTYIGMAKWVAVAAVLGGAAIGFYKLATRGGDPDANRARDEAIAKAEEMSKLRAQVAERHDSLANAREAFEETCAPVARAQLVQLLREDSQPSEAARLEKEPCRQRKPPCSYGRDDAQQRLTEKFALDDSNELWDWRCAGGRFGAQRGLAVALVAKDHKGKRVALRGVVDPSGRGDLVAAVPSPHDVFEIETGDLDGDGVDEIITIHDRGIGIWRVRDGKFVDIPAPPMIAEAPHDHACTGSIEIVTDPETKMREQLVLTISDDARGKGCPSPGEHVYELEGDKLVEHQ